MGLLDFKKIMDSTREAVCISDLNKSVSYINKAFSRLLGYRFEYFKNNRLSDIYIDNKLYYDCFKTVLSGESYTEEADIVRIDGTVIPVNIKADPLIDDTGRIIGIISSYSDISSQRINENRLRLLIELQMKLLEPASIHEKMKYITDALVSAVNADYARIWIYKPKDLCNRGCIHRSDDTYPEYCMNNEFCLHLTASSGCYTDINGTQRRIPFGAYKTGKIADGQMDFFTNNAEEDSLIRNNEWASEKGLVSFTGFKLSDSDNNCKGILAFFSKKEVTEDIRSYVESLSHLTSQVIMNSESETEIKKALNTAERANTLMAGREIRIREIKKEVNNLTLKLGETKKYIDMDSDNDSRFSSPEMKIGLKDSINNALSLAEDAEIARRETVELNEQISRIHQAVNSSSDAIAISTPHGEFFYINKTFTDLFGYTVAALAMCEIQELFYNPSIGSTALEFAGLGESWKGEVDIIAVNDNQFPALLRVDPFKDNSGKILGIIWIFTDITERKFAEETIFQYAKAMEKDLEEKKEMLAKARYLQNSFIKKTLPTVKEFNIYTLFMPCEKLGGDFFRIARGNLDNKLVIILGDCTDHGIKASLDASLLASISEDNLQYLFNGNRTDLFLNTVNSEFMKYADEDQFPTMFAAVIDLENKEMFYSNANSELPILVNNEGIKRLDPVGGLHIGYFENGNYERKQLYLEQGTRIVFFSDAVIEIEKEGNIRKGYPWFEEVLTEFCSSQESTGFIFNSLIEQIKEENGGFPLKDDTTLIMMELISCDKKLYQYNRYSECDELYDDIKKRLSYLDYTETEINQIYISLEEMCLNAFNHGNRNDENKCVEISVDINCSHACFSVTDEGNGFDPDKVVDPVLSLETLLDRDEEEKYTHGRGIWITKHHMDSVVYTKKGNSVKIVKNKKQTSLREE